MRALPAALLCLALVSGSPGVVGAADGSSGEVALTRDVRVAMRDGTHLATDVYRPARAGAPLPGRFPALLMRTPYNKDLRAESFAGYFTARGYVVVVQDVRARYRSEGHWRPLYDDGRDGYDTAAWIGRQDWSDGAIGTLGTSYEGGTQHALAIAGAPHLKAMIPLFSMSDVGRYGVRNKGRRGRSFASSAGSPRRCRQPLELADLVTLRGETALEMSGELSSNTEPQLLRAIGRWSMVEASSGCRHRSPHCSGVRAQQRCCWPAPAWARSSPATPRLPRSSPRPAARISICGVLSGG